MPDGVRLAARLWRPVIERPVPAILEYIPYRKADMVRARDERNHPFFAANGYACIRVDMRGSGDSEGHMPDMYAPDELSDARHVINWLAVQNWCNGNVGMFGTSWGGTASLQASVNAPGPLKAVIAVCATHDRFEDDIHYMGGAVLTDTFEWGATLPTILASPPTPIIGSNWMECWRDRIDHLAFPLENWLRENARESFWRHGSVSHQTRELSVPILAVGGWSDRYSNSVMPLADARPDLVWGVIGPWGHHYPDHGNPGPAIGFQRMALEWWDHWLKSPRPEPIDWPRMRVWLRDFDTPADMLESRNGNWIQTGTPATETAFREFELAEMTPDSAPWPIPRCKNVGTASGDTGYFGRSGGLPLDQSPDDASSLVFETPPLEQDLLLYGAARVLLQGSTDSGAGTVVARLVDVSPSGKAARIAYGLRNLALNDALDHPETPPQPGAFEFDLGLHSTAYTLRKGHRLRLSVSQTLWPIIAAPPPGMLALTSGRLALPILSGSPQPLALPFPDAKTQPPVPTHEQVKHAPLVRWHEVTENAEEIGWHQPETAVYYPETETTFGYETRMRHRLQSGGTVSTTTLVAHQMRFGRPEGEAVVEIDLQASRPDAFWQVSANLTVTWNGEEFAKRQWSLNTPTMSDTD